MKVWDWREHTLPNLRASFFQKSKYINFKVLRGSFWWTRNVWIWFLGYQRIFATHSIVIRFSLKINSSKLQYNTKWDWSWKSEFSKILAYSFYCLKKWNSASVIYSHSYRETNIIRMLSLKRVPLRMICGPRNVPVSSCQLRFLAWAAVIVKDIPTWST